MPALPVLVAASFAAGIALALLTGARAGAAAAVLALAAAGTAAAAWRRRTVAVLTAALAGLAAAGAALGGLAESRARAPHLDRFAGQPGPLRIEGVLTEDASAGASGVGLRVAVAAIGGMPADRREVAALSVGGDLAAARMDQWRAGRRVRAWGAVRRPAHYRNPGVPDDRHALARRGLTLVGTVKSGALVDVVAEGSWRQERSADLRARVRRVLGARVAPHDATAAGVATAILIGDRTGLDAEVERRLQAAGTYHVIAISGGNIAVLTAVLLGLARLARVPAVAAGPLVAALLVAHAGVVGPAASVTRATAMAVIYLGLRALDQSAWSVNALAAACGGLLAASPLSLLDPGFLLSAGATAAILTVALRLSAMARVGGWRRAAAGVVGASLATEIVLMPISATLFNRVTFAGLLLNLAAVPLMAVVQVSASVTVLADAVLPAVAGLAGAVAAWSGRALVASGALIEHAPWLAIRTPAPHWTVTAAYLTAVVVLAALPSMPLRRRRVRHLAARASLGTALAMALVVLAAPGTWRWWWRADGVLRVVSLDVGQGDATLIEFPDGTRWLVDAGGLAGASRYDIGARVVAPALWARGVGRLDALLLTHGDPDHVGGAAAVLDDFRPDVLEGIAVPSHTPLQQLADRARRRGRAWTTVRRGRRVAVGGVDVHIRHPPEPDWERQRVRNDDSVVVELRYGDVSVVLPGESARTWSRTWPRSPRRPASASSRRRTTAARRPRATRGSTRCVPTSSSSAAAVRTGTATRPRPWWRASKPGGPRSSGPTATGRWWWRPTDGRSRRGRPTDAVRRS